MEYIKSGELIFGYCELSTLVSSLADLFSLDQQKKMTHVEYRLKNLSGTFVIECPFEELNDEDVENYINRHINEL